MSEQAYLVGTVAGARRQILNLMNHAGYVVVLGARVEAIGEARIDKRIGHGVRAADSGIAVIRTAAWSISILALAACVLVSEEGVNYQ